MPIVLRVMRSRDFDPGQLLAGGTEFMHVTHGAHAVDVVRGRAIGGFEVEFSAGPARGHRAGARLAGQRDQRDAAFARCNRLRGMAEMDQIGAAAGVSGIEMPDLQAQIVDHRHHPARSVASAEITVDISLGQACVFQRAFGDLGM